MRYRTIVADPPWPHEEFFYARERERPVLPYPSMSVSEIKDLPVRALSTPDTRPERSGSHLYLWSTHQFLWDARDVALAWGFKPINVLVWCKWPPMPTGLFPSSVEFVLYCRRGAPPSLGKADRQWFTWPGRGAHSSKPDAFFDLVEQISPGPYLELFARRQRLGWDTWGDEALNHVEMSA